MRGSPTRNCSIPANLVRWSVATRAHAPTCRRPRLLSAACMKRRAGQVLTAAAEGKPAFEGYEGHGVFTWALLDALKNGDRNGNGFIELSELVAHVQDQVPRIAAKLNGRGRAAVAARESTDAVD
jgi:hypothetical protein